MSSAMACMATRLMSSGAAKSGKPCERFTAPCFNASRVISRITDSVKRFAFFETRWCLETIGVVMTVFAANSLCSLYVLLCLGGEPTKEPHPRDTKHTETSQKVSDTSVELLIFTL